MTAAMMKRFVLSRFKTKAKKDFPDRGEPKKISYVLKKFEDNWTGKLFIVCENFDKERMMSEKEVSELLKLVPTNYKNENKSQVVSGIIELNWSENKITLQLSHKEGKDTVLNF